MRQISTGLLFFMLVPPGMLVPTGMLMGQTPHHPVIHNGIAESFWLDAHRTGISVDTDTGIGIGTGISVETDTGNGIGTNIITNIITNTYSSASAGKNAYTITSVRPGKWHFEFDANYTSGSFMPSANRPSPLGALLRSFVVPGWGHHYVDSDNWGRGQLHLGGELVLLTSWLGISRQAYVLEKNMYTHAAAYSGADIKSRERAFELAVGSHRSLADYNDYQERTRNLDRLFPDEPRYRWEWESDELRREYLDLRSRRDNLTQQLPALVALMVANRVLSGISAYSRARAIHTNTASVHLAPGPSVGGFQAVFSIPF